MIYVIFDGDIPIGVKSEYSKGLLSRSHWTSYKEVCRIARLLEVTTGKKYLGVDQGSYVYPRFDIIEPFKIGDNVSYTFNGDYYPDGYIVKITPSLNIITCSGKRYRRHKNTSMWIMEGGTWSLVHGHISDKNPSF